MKIELIYDNECPNVAATRKNLLKALTQLDLAPKWIELDRDDKRLPEYVHCYGSPAVLVDGVDIVDFDPNEANCCRLYQDEESSTFNPFPSVDMITQALLRSIKDNSKSPNRNKRFSWRSLIAAFPSAFIALLPKFTCPLCWPFYAGLLSSLGIPLTNYTPYLLPFTILFLCIALLVLAFRAKQRRGYKPLLLGTIAAIIILAGKFLFYYNPSLYVGVAILIAASIWNSWPIRSKSCCQRS